MASGIQMNKACEDAFAALSKRDHSTIVLKITNNKDDVSEIVVDKVFPPLKGEPEKEWKELVSAIPTNECRYIIADFSWKDNPTVLSSKIILIAWSPDDASAKMKVPYSSSVEAVTSKLTVQRQVQATDADELEYKFIKEKVGK